MVALVLMWHLDLVGVSRGVGDVWMAEGLDGNEGGRSVYDRREGVQTSSEMVMDGGYDLRYGWWHWFRCVWMASKVSDLSRGAWI